MHHKHIRHCACIQPRMLSLRVRPDTTATAVKVRVKVTHYTFMNASFIHSFIHESDAWMDDWTVGAVTEEDMCLVSIRLY